MPYCPDCGVEIGNAPVCPLCGARNPRAGKSANPEGGAQTGAAGSEGRAECAEEKENAKPYFLEGSPSSESFTPPEKRKIVWEVISVALVIAIMVLGAINFLVEGILSWSLYPIATFAFIWVLSTAGLMLGGNKPWRYVLAAIDAPLFLLAVSAITGDISWSLKLAIPIAVYAEIVVVSVGLLTYNAKRKGLNIIAFVLVGIAFVCIGVEIFVDLYVLGHIALSWSAITAIALVPIAGFLLYLHYRVAKTTNLRRLFRL